MRNIVLFSKMVWSDTKENTNSSSESMSRCILACEKGAETPLCVGWKAFGSKRTYSIVFAFLIILHFRSGIFTQENTKSFVQKGEQRCYSEFFSSIWDENRRMRFR